MTITKPKFYTSAGRLTAYALSCGYVEQKDYGPVRIRLWMEHGVYHVRAYDHEAGKRRFWETFRTLGEARRHYDHGEALAGASK